MKNTEAEFLQCYSEYQNIPSNIYLINFYDLPFEAFVQEYNLRLYSSELWCDKNYQTLSEKELHLIQEVAENLFRKNILDKKMESLLLNLDIEYFIESNVISSEQYEALKEKKNLNPTEEEMLNDYKVYLILDDVGDIEQKVNQFLGSFRSKYNFLSHKLEMLGYYMYYSEGIQIEKIAIEPEELSFSNSGKVMSTARSKFIMINELKIIDFLKDKHPDLPDSSIHKILTDITGDNQQPVYSAFNGRTFNPGSHNNPYRDPGENRPNPVEIIRNRLRGYGINIDN